MNRSCEPDLAAEWAASAWRNLELTIPVDLHKVRRHLKLRLRKSDLGYNPGHLLKTAKCRYAVLNLRDCLERQRFTLAHEIGEFLLMQHYERLGRVPPVGERAERFCDRFATMLLMPADLVNDVAAELGHGPRNPKADVLASRFGVSMQAMRQRLRELSRHNESRF